MDCLSAALLGGLVAAVLTSLGSLAALPLHGLTKRLDRLMDVGLAFSAGVMLVASFTSLLLPAVEEWGLPLPLTGFLAGAAVMALVHYTVPHEHIVRGVYDGPAWGRRLRAALLVAAAILIHNLPEGMAIGAASLYEPERGMLLGTAIGLQDLPEGFAVTLPLIPVTGGRLKALAVGVLSGFSELLAAVLTALLGQASSLPFLMGFGAGAMIFVVVREAIPEAFRGGYEDAATLGFFAGFILMLVLDTISA